MDNIEKFIYTETDAKGCKLIDNNDLLCKDCIYSFKNIAGVCAEYENGKPAEVFDFNKCKKYKKD